MKIIIIILIEIIQQIESKEIISFQEFKIHYKKEYKNQEEENQRKEIYERNIEKIQEHNQQQYQYNQGINWYTDYTDEELFQLTQKTRKERFHHWKTIHKNHQFHTQNETLFKRKTQENIPLHYALCGSEAEIDYCGTLHIDQGVCGCCYAAGTAHHLSTLYSYVYHHSHPNELKRELISVQQLIDCNKQWGGCAGGYAEFCLDSNDQFVFEKDYPFIDYQTDCETVQECHSYQHHCKTDNSSLKAHLQLKDLQKRYRYFSRVSWEEIKEIIYTYHGFITAMKVSPSLYRYSGGIYKDESCQNQITDHVVVVDGYGEEGNRKYLWVRNSWGSSWGIENGHFKIDFETLCGINNRDEYQLENGNVVYLDNNLIVEVELTDTFFTEKTSFENSSLLSFNMFIFILLFILL